MKNNEKQAEKLTELLKGAEDHPLIKQLFAAQAAALLATRTTAADQIKAIEKERDEALPKLQTDIEKKEAIFLKAKATFEEAGRSFQSARAALSTENNNFSYSISHLEQSLIESADPQIDDAIQFFRDKLEWLRSPGKIETHRLGAERDIYTETVAILSENNIQAINDAMQFCRDAIQALELMKLEPAFDLQKIEALKKAIPDINIFTESKGEKPMEGSRPRSLASYFKSDSHHDYDMRRLLEKADKSLAAKRAK